MISSFEVVSFIVTLEALSSNIVIDASRVDVRGLELRKILDQVC